MTTVAEPLRDAVVAFDLDGTLVDTAPDLVGSLNVVLGSRGLAPVPLDRLRASVPRGTRWLIEFGFAANGVELAPTDLSDMTSRFMAVYRDRITHESRPFEGCQQALSKLKASEAKLCVCSNKPTLLAVELLRALGLLEMFDAVLGGDSAVATKPDPRHLQAAVSAVGGKMDRTILVGDGEADAGAARSAGAGLILVSFGYCEQELQSLAPDALIDTYEELPAACAGLLLRRGGRGVSGH